MKKRNRNLVLIVIYIIAFSSFEGDLFMGSVPNQDEKALSPSPDLNYLDSVAISTSVESPFGNMEIIRNDTILLNNLGYGIMHMYDINDPSNIVDLGETEAFVSTEVIESYGDLLFISDVGGIRSYNMTDINNPVEDTNYGDLTAQKLEALNGFLYAIYQPLGGNFGTYNLSKSGSEALIANWSAPSADINFKYLSVTEEGIALLGYQDGIMLLNVTNATNPTFIGEIETPEFPESFSYYKGALYLSDAKGLRIYDTTDPSNITQIGNFLGGKYVYTTTLTQNDLLFGVNDGGIGSLMGFYCLNITDPKSISIVCENINIAPYEALIHDNEIYFYGQIMDPSSSESGDLAGIPGDSLTSFDLSEDPGSDLDGDGLIYIKEIWNLNSDPKKNDTDDDGLPDNYEAQFYDVNMANTNPEFTIVIDVADSEKDADSDALTNLEEFKFNTNPILVDTDGDGVDDGLELIRETDPLDRTDTPDVIDTGTILFAVIGLALVAGMVLENFLKKKPPINTFLSHAVINFEPYKIKEMAEELQSLQPINKALYCELDMKGNIDEWMDEMVPLSHIFVFLATEKSVFNSPDCGREIRLAKENKLLLIPLKTEEVEWKDIGEIGLPTEGFDYALGNFKDVVGNLKEYIKEKEEKMEELGEILKKNSFINLSSLDKTLEVDKEEVPKLARILIKSQQINGVVSKTGENFMSESEVKNMIKSYQKQGTIKSIEVLMDTLNIDPLYQSEIEDWAKLPKKEQDKEDDNQET